MQSLTLTAFGKINLALDIIGRRPDGYHLLRMVMQQVELGDFITLEQQQESFSLTMRPPHPELCKENNMTWKAFHLMQKQYGFAGSVHIDLEKRLPLAAGLAGGSSDAAAVMTGVSRLWQLSCTQKELCRLGLSLGADVPYCLTGGTMLAEGIGEQLTPLPAAPNLWVVLANPGFPVDTGEIFRHFDLNKKGPVPDVDGMTEALAQKDIPRLIECQNNVLESVTFQRYPQVAKLKQDMIGCGLPAMMSGSGGSVLGLLQDQEAGQEITAFLQKRWPWVALTKLLHSHA